MGRSYLFTGRDTEHLSPTERQLEALYDRLDRPGYRLSPTQFFQLPEAQQLLDQLHGALTDRIPPGSQIVSQTPGKLTYKDPEGYEHNVIRKPDGQFTETTNRPAIVPNAASQGQQSTLEALRQRVEQGYTQPAQFASLPPELQAQLDAINAAERGDIQKQATDARGQLVAQLYGNKVNQSSIADDQSARFLEALGRINQQQASGAAQRSIGLQQYLTDLIQRQGEGAASLYSNLSGQGTQRDIASAGLDLDKLKLNESSREFNLSNYLDQLKTQQQQEALDQANSPFNKFLKTLSAAGALAQGAGTAYSAFRR